jgi:hypothetical protein
MNVEQMQLLLAMPGRALRTIHPCDTSKLQLQVQRQKKVERHFFDLWDIHETSQNSRTPVLSSGGRARRPQGDRRVEGAYWLHPLRSVLMANPGNVPEHATSIQGHIPKTT